MTDQLTQCPHCQSTFRVTPTQLGAAKGLVRCGSCLGIFSASINFIRVKPALDELDDDQTDIHQARPSIPATVANRDEVSLGDFDLDGVETDAEDEDDLDELDDIEADLEDMDMASAMQEADAILLESISMPEPAEIRQFLTYEEYQDVPDLFDQLDEADALAANAQADDVSLEEADQLLDIDADELDADSSEFDELNTEESEEPDDEFHPPGFIDEDEDEDEAGDEDGEVDYDDAVEAIALETSSDDSDWEDMNDQKDQNEEDEDELDLEELFDEFEEEFEPEIRPEASSKEQTLNTTSSNIKPDWLTQENTNIEEKAKLHGYLSTLEDDDELQPLDHYALDALEAEPVLLASGNNKRGLLATLGLLLVSLLLIATLALQFVDQHLDQLSKRNSFTPYKPLFCRILACPAAVEATALSALYSQELLIRTHPHINNALELTFIFRNDSDAAQSFPGLELSFKDIDNHLLANRVFLPGEYLPAELQQLKQMPAMSSLQVLLELADPGEKAVNYTIAFREI